MLRGSPWVDPGLVVLPTMNKFVFWVTEPFHSLDGNKEKNKGERTSASCEHCAEGS